MLFSDTAAALGNWLEEACLSGEDYNADCQGIPYVRVLDGDGAGPEKSFLTSSVREPHRLASPYVLSAKRHGEQETLKDWLRKPDQLAVNKQRPVRPWVLAQKLFTIDPGCILHGVFLEELDGRLRLPRLLSGFIEAANPNQVTAKDNIPFPKQEFTSDDIQASFVLHLSTLHGHKLLPDRERFLILWAFYKIDELLRGCLRLRSGCEFVKTSINPTIDGKHWSWPSSEDIRSDFAAAKAKCFPEIKSETDNWKKFGVLVVSWQEDVKPTGEPLTGNLAKESFNLTGFEGRAEIKEHKYTSGIGKQKKEEKKLSLVLAGTWDDSDFDELLEQHPKPDLEGKDSQKAISIHDLVSNAIKAHKKVLDDRKKKQEKNAGNDVSTE
jgi:CRISPR-associated protein Csb1